MAGRIKWSGGGPHAMLAKFETMERKALDQGETLITELTHEAAIRQAKILEDATTKTGERRAATGGRSSQYGSTSPGRVDSGLMINQINSRVERDDNSVSGTWGWFDPEEYFSAQDNGTGRIPAANSLFGSYVEAREKFLSGISQIVRGLK